MSWPRDFGPQMVMYGVSTVGDDDYRRQMRESMERERQRQAAMLPTFTFTPSDHATKADLEALAQRLERAIEALKPKPHTHRKRARK